MTHSHPSSRFALALVWLTRFFAALLPVLIILIWWFWTDLAPEAGTGLDVAALDTQGRLIGFTLAMAAALFQSYGLLGLVTTFMEAAGGRALSAAAVAGFKRFAWVTLLLVPVRFLITTATMVLVSMSDDVPGAQLTLKVGSGELSAAFVGLLLVFTAQVFAQGQAAQSENEAFL